MTLSELDRDSFQPIKRLLHPGTYVFECPICKAMVGSYRSRAQDPVTFGLYYYRDECQNGHVMNWELVPEYHEEYAGRVI